jgi:hypothetical protein
MYYNKDQDAVTRDYAIQHLIAWHEREGGIEPATKETIQKVLQEAALESDSIAGTALLGLHRISTKEPSINYQEVNKRALDLALSDKTQLATRVTAVQVCSERNLKEALPMIQLLAQNADNIPLQLSAIAALGRLGDSNQIVVLRRLEREKDQQIQSAVRAALKRLSQEQELF